MKDSHSSEDGLSRRELTRLKWLALDPVQHRLYVAAESGPLTVFAEDGGTVRELVKADAGPNAHSVAVDPETHHIYLPLQNVNGHPVLREMTVEP